MIISQTDASNVLKNPFFLSTKICKCEPCNLVFFNPFTFQFHLNFCEHHTNDKPILEISRDNQSFIEHYLTK